MRKACALSEVAKAEQPGFYEPFRPLLPALEVQYVLIDPSGQKRSRSGPPNTLTTLLPSPHANDWGDAAADLRCGERNS